MGKIGSFFLCFCKSVARNTIELNYNLQGTAIAKLPFESNDIYLLRDFNINLFHKGHYSKKYLLTFFYPTIDIPGHVESQVNKQLASTYGLFPQYDDQLGQYVSLSIHLSDTESKLRVNNFLEDLKNVKNIFHDL